VKWRGKIFINWDTFKFHFLFCYILSSFLIIFIVSFFPFSSFPLFRFCLSGQHLSSIPLFNLVSKCRIFFLHLYPITQNPLLFFLSVSSLLSSLLSSETNMCSSYSFSVFSLFRRCSIIVWVCVCVSCFFSYCVTLRFPHFRSLLFSFYFKLISHCLSLSILLHSLYS